MAGSEAQLVPPEGGTDARQQTADAGSGVGEAVLSTDSGSPPSTLSADAGVSLGADSIPAPVQAAPELDLAGGPERRSERGSGTLRGRVVSAEDESPLEGASLYVRGDSHQTQTDGSGAFSLSLPAGTHQLSVINPGFSTQSISKVEIRPGQTAVLNIKLQPGSVQLEEMVVVGARIKGGVATLIAERRQATAVADVIGAEQMSRSGDSNAAAALSRVTGITVIDGRYVIVRGMGERYSTMTLNRFQVPSPDPTRRVVPLDIFPAGVIDSVVVQKSYSADLPGEFGGGLVQLRSRDYPHKFLFSLNAATGGNFNSLFHERLTYQGGKYDLLGIDDGGRKLPSNFEDERGKVVLDTGTGTGYSEEEIEDLGESLPRKYNTHNEQTWPDLTLGANVGNEWRLRRAKIGFVAAAGYRSEYRSVLDAVNRFYTTETLDYRVDQYRRQISLSGFLDWGVEFSSRHKLKSTTMLLRQTDDTTQLRTDVDSGERRTILSWIERQVFLEQVTGTHTFEELRKFQLDWRYAFGLAGRLEPNRRGYTYIKEQDVYAFAPGSGTNASLFGELADTTHEVQLDLTQPFPLWRRLEGKIKVGGQFYRRDRKADSRTFEFVVSTSVDRVLPPNDVITPENIGDGVTFQEVTRETDSYDAWMQVEAGYASLELPVLKSLDVSGGARVEHAHIETTTFDPFDPMAPPTLAKLDNIDVLPSATLTWRFAEDFQARASYSRTLNRPDFRELSTSRYFDLESNLLLAGNNELKRALIENFDARLEWYYTPDEVFSIGGFLKRFTDPIETKRQAAQEEVYTLSNVDEAISYGLELEGRKRLGFIARVLEAMYVAANFSLIGSRVEVDLVDGGVHKRPLQGQSPWVINAQLGWDDSDEGGTGTSASLLFNSAGKRIRVIGDPDIEQGDIYELPIHRLDFVVSQKLPRDLKLGARVRNILNATEKWTVDGQTQRKFRRGADFQVSLAWSY